MGGDLGGGDEAQTPTPPSVQIANGAVTATVYLPDAATGFYRDYTIP